MFEMDNCDFVIKSARCKGLTQVEFLKVEFLRKLSGDTSDMIGHCVHLGKLTSDYRKSLRLTFRFI